jgi:hypothetical protein
MEDTDESGERAERQRLLWRDQKRKQREKQRRAPAGTKEYIQRKKTNLKAKLRAREKSAEKKRLKLLAKQIEEKKSRRQVL